MTSRLDMTSMITNGDIKRGAIIRVLMHGTNILAPLYDVNGVQIPNPITTSQGGALVCWATDASDYDLVVIGRGTERVYTRVSVG